MSHPEAADHQAYPKRLEGLTNDPGQAMRVFKYVKRQRLRKVREVINVLFWDHAHHTRPHRADPKKGHDSVIFVHAAGFSPSRYYLTKNTRQLASSGSGYRTPG